MKDVFDLIYKHDLAVYVADSGLHIAPEDLPVLVNIWREAGGAPLHAEVNEELLNPPEPLDFDGTEEGWNAFHRRFGLFTSVVTSADGRFAALFEERGYFMLCAPAAAFLDRAVDALAGYDTFTYDRSGDDLRPRLLELRAITKYVLFDEVRRRAMKHSIGDPELVLGHDGALALLKELTDIQVAVVAWEGWALHPDGTVGHAPGYQGTVPVRREPGEHDTTYAARANAFQAQTIEDDFGRWKAAETGWELNFCLTPAFVRPRLRSRWRRQELLLTLDDLSDPDLPSKARASTLAAGKLSLAQEFMIEDLDYGWWDAVGMYAYTREEVEAVQEVRKAFEAIRAKVLHLSSDDDLPPEDDDRWRRLRVSAANAAYVLKQTELLP